MEIQNLDHINNLPGLNILQYCFAKDIAQISLSLDELKCYGVTLNSGKVWHNIYYTQQTLEFTETLVQNNGGRIYNATISCLIPNDDIDRTNAFNVIDNRGVVLLVTDNNGVTKLVGTKQTPLRLTSGLVKLENSNQYQLNFIGKLKTRSPLL